MKVPTTKLAGRKGPTDQAPVADESIQLSLANYRPAGGPPKSSGADWLESVPTKYPPKEEFRTVKASTSLELSFVGGFFPKAQKGFSHTVELFDALPKFVFARLRKKKLIEILTRRFQHRGEHYELELKPAAIKTEEGAFLMFPGEREELVLRALRYMAAQQLSPLSLWGHDQGHTQMRLVFTLSQLQNVLAEKLPGAKGRQRGHMFKLAEIDEALQVCQGTVMALEFSDGNKRARHQSGILSEYYALDEVGGGGQKAQRCVIFHPLATTAALRLEYRSINYRRLMSLPTPLARWIYERLSHLFTNAEKHRPMSEAYRPRRGFTLEFETVLNQSGILRRKRLRSNIQEVRAALKELSLAGVLVPPGEESAKGGTPFVESLVYDEGNSAGAGRRPLVGATWTLYPSDLLVQEIIEANIEYRDRLKPMVGPS